MIQHLAGSKEGFGESSLLVLRIEAWQSKVAVVSAINGGGIVVVVLVVVVLMVVAVKVVMCAGPQI